jgi:tetratricopeptide (TPR) repeat protein
MSHANRQIDSRLRLGMQLHGSGRLAEAGQIYQEVLAASPGHPEAMHMIGVLLLQTGQPGQALVWLEQAISEGEKRFSGREVVALSPFQVHRAHALLALGRPRDAISAAQAGLQARRGNAEAHQVLGHAQVDAGDYDQAVAAYQEAARMRPELPDLLNNLGTALHHANQLDEAARVLQRAHAKEPTDAGILVNLSSVLRDLGRFDEAETRLTRALRLAPANPVVKYNHALLMLLLGRFDQAWAGWEARFAAGATLDRGFKQPRWLGEPLAGRRLLIHAEQGLGDTIQFCRYPFPVDGEVFFEVPPRLARLLGGQQRAATIIPAGEPPPPFDVACPLMSLLAVNQTSEATIPANVPYLTAEPALVERWRQRLGEHGFRVGIAWQGNPLRREDNGRSIGLAHFLPLASVAGVRLISLQKETGLEQLAGGMPIETLGDDFDAGTDAFIDTAAVMMNLDLVITSDTAIPHLAGALGCPVWVALRAVPDWRFMLERPDSPWYPTMRLFRQTTRDDWPPVFAAIKEALAARVASAPSGGNHG